MALSRGRASERPSFWPGYVDALSSLLLVIIFLLSIFMIAQFFLNQEILGQDTAMQRLNAQIAELTELLQLERTGAQELELTIASLSATLEDTREERDTLEQQLAGIGAGYGDAQERISGLESELSEERELTREAEAQVALLNQQLAALRQQIGALEAALDAAEQRDVESRTQIADLGRRLNVALAQRVQDLTRYRSDFFGRMREALEGRSDVEVVGDRFVFQSEVLFDAGEAQISAEGREQITALADAILELEETIPSDIPWVLRIDGHTDRRPISTPRFPSNWELSASRAISVAKLLVDEGVPPNRLVAAGFGEFAPLDPDDTEEAYRRNRRIEFKLTEG